MTISAIIIEMASVFTSLTIILGAIWAAFKFFHRQHMQDEEIHKLQQDHIKDMTLVREEQQVICYGILACLDGLKQQGCNGNVTKAYTALEKHLNKAAHIV